MRRQQEAAAASAVSESTPASSPTASTSDDSFVIDEAEPEDDVEEPESIVAQPLQQLQRQRSGTSLKPKVRDAEEGDEAKELNQDLMHQCRRAFQEFENGSGFLLTRDLGSALRALGQVPSEAQVNQLTARLDQTDLYDKGCTKLTFQEFYQAAQEFNTTKVEVRKSVMDAFYVFDTANSGTVEVNRLMSVLASMGEALGPADIRELMKELPVDKDGRVDYTSRS